MEASREGGPWERQRCGEESQGRLDGGVGRPEPLPTTTRMKLDGGSVEEEGSRERSSCDRGMEEA
jgi:hypothetical protein